MYLSNSNNVSTKTVTDSKISTHRFLQAYMYSVRKPLFNCDICNRTSWSISTKKCKKHSRKGGIDISKKRMSAPFFKRNIFELLERRWQIKMRNLFLNNNFARNTY